MHYDIIDQVLQCEDVQKRIEENTFRNNENVDIDTLTEKIENILKPCVRYFPPVKMWMCALPPTKENWVNLHFINERDFLMLLQEIVDRIKPRDMYGVFHETFLELRSRLRDRLEYAPQEKHNNNDN